MKKLLPCAMALFLVSCSSPQYTEEKPMSFMEYGKKNREIASKVIDIQSLNLAGKWECIDPTTDQGQLLFKLFDERKAVDTKKQVDEELKKSLGLVNSSNIFEIRKGKDSFQFFIGENNAKNAEFFSTQYNLNILIPGEKTPLTFPIQKNGIGPRSLTIKKDTGDAENDISCSKAQKSPGIIDKPF